MGRLVKNYQITTGSHTVQLPIGSSTVTPDVRVNGQVAYNTGTNKYEFYANSALRNPAFEGTVSVIRDSFTLANGVTNYGPMTYTYTAGATGPMVFIGGVFQSLGTNYNFQGNAYISITSPNGTAGQTITVIHNLDSTVVG